MTKLISKELENIAIKAKNASIIMATANSEQKNNILIKLKELLTSNFDFIQQANQKDLHEAKKLVEKGQLSPSLYKRLALSETKYNEMLKGLDDVVNLPDPVGKILLETELDDSLVLKKVNCPIGVIGVIFESRPDVVIQISALAIKSGNSVILKGGSEAINTNIVFINIINEAFDYFKEIPEGVVSLITKREEVRSMLELDQYIDLIIPRGSNEFVKYIQANTRIPVLGHSEGICHIYVDEKADLKMALTLCLDSKTDYPAACNAVETILLHKNVSAVFIPQMLEIFNKAYVEVRCEKGLIDRLNLQNIKIASEEDWATEYNDLIVSIKEVQDINQAINHINQFGSGHTDCIITDDKNNAEYFMNRVDASGVYWNASTRFADGYRYGFGAEVGISTNKTHSRGPVGLEGLMIYKYKLYGRGQIVSDYSKGLKQFKHKSIKP